MGLFLSGVIMSERNGPTTADPNIKYKFIRPVYEVNRVCPLYHLADTTNELSALLKENNIKFIIGGSSALGTAINVTSDYMRRRTSCDIDLFVTKGDYRKIDRLFEDYGWEKYGESESGLIREYLVEEDDKQTVISEYQNIKNFVVYHKAMPYYNVNFLIYQTPIGRFSMKLVRGGELLEERGYNRSAEESFVHKIFRYSRRDKSDFLAIAETDGLQQVLDEKYARRTFKGYIEKEENLEKLDYLMGRMDKIRDRYWNLHAAGKDIMKKKRQKKKAPKEMKVTIHYQTKVIPTTSPYFQKLMILASEKVHWIGESLKTLEELLEE